MNEQTHKALIALADELRGQPFRWGDTDCVTLALRALDVILGRDVSSAWRGTWADEAEARRVAGDYRPSVVAAALGLCEVEPHAASDGDILIAPSVDWAESCHVVLGRYALSSSPAHGVTLVRTAAVQGVALSAWRAA